jgi:hypothetical protein
MTDPSVAVFALMSSAEARRTNAPSCPRPCARFRELALAHNADLAISAAKPPPQTRIAWPLTC